MSEARLRELLAEYAADEPPMRLQPEQVMHPRGRSPWRVTLAAAAAAALVVGGVWGAVRLAGDRSSHKTTVATASSSRAPQRVSAVTPPEQMLETIRELGLAAYPDATTGSVDAYIWTVSPTGGDTVVTGSDLAKATEWVGSFPAPGAADGTGLSITASILPPDVEPTDVLSCGGMRSVDRCQAGLLPDGRAYREFFVDPQLGQGEPRLGDLMATHVVNILDGDVSVAAMETRRFGGDLTSGWRVPSERLLTLVTNPSLVPPRPDPVPALPSGRACGSAAPPVGCPHRPTAVVSLPAGQVLARMRDLAAVAIGPDAVEVASISSWAYRNALPQAAWGEATAVSATFTSAAQHRYLRLEARFLQPGTSRPGTTVDDPPCEPQGSDRPQCFVTLRAGGATEIYALHVFPGFTPPQAWTDVSVFDGQLVVTAAEGYLGVPPTTPFDSSRITLTRADLSGLANDPGLRLAAPTPLPTVPTGESPCYPGTEGTKDCPAFTAPTGG